MCEQNFEVFTYIICSWFILILKFKENHLSMHIKEICCSNLMLAVNRFIAKFQCCLSATFREALLLDSLKMLKNVRALFTHFDEM